MENIQAHIRCEHACKPSYYQSAAFPLCEECIDAHAWPKIWFSGLSGSITIGLPYALPPSQWAKLNALIAGRVEGEWEQWPLSFTVDVDDSLDVYVIVDVADVLRIDCDADQWAGAARRALYLSKLWSAVHLYREIADICPRFEQVVQPDDLLRMVQDGVADVINTVKVFDAVPGVPELIAVLQL